MMIIFFIIIAIIYLIGYIITDYNITNHIKNYIDESEKSGFLCREIDTWLKDNHQKIALIGGIGWPIYYSFYLGTELGEIFYDTILNNDYENRVATWFI